jgi:pimeloyl-ACP methyl ester carboxylesterase
METSMRAWPIVALAAVFALELGITAASRAAEPSPQVPNALLVQDSAEKTRWQAVIPLLEAGGLKVTVIETAAGSLDAAVAETRRVLALEEGQMVLVGHGRDGAVISEIGMDPKVAALVYVAAVAPEAGEDFTTLAKRFPVKPDTAQPTQTEPFVSGTIRAVAWRDKPTFYAVSQQDAAMSAGLQRFYAARMNALTIVLEAGHYSMESHPREIAGLILQAAGAKPAPCASADQSLACAAPALPRSLMKGCKCSKEPIEALTQP